MGDEACLGIDSLIHWAYRAIHLPSLMSAADAGAHIQFINSHWKQSVGSLMQRCFYTPCSFHAARSHNVPLPYGTKTPSNECSRSHISDHCLSNSVGVDYVNVCYAETVMMY